MGAAKISDDMKTVFPQLSFLWTGEKMPDTADGLNVWKGEALYGPGPRHEPLSSADIMMHFMFWQWRCAVLYGF